MPAEPGSCFRHRMLTFSVNQTTRKFGPLHFKPGECHFRASAASLCGEDLPSISFWGPCPPQGTFPFISVNAIEHPADAQTTPIKQISDWVAWSRCPAEGAYRSVFLLVGFHCKDLDGRSAWDPDTMPPVVCLLNDSNLDKEPAFFIAHRRSSDFSATKWDMKQDEVLFLDTLIDGNWKEVVSNEREKSKEKSKEDGEETLDEEGSSLSAGQLLCDAILDKIKNLAGYSLGCLGDKSMMMERNETPLIPDLPSRPLAHAPAATLRDWNKLRDRREKLIAGLSQPLSVFGRASPQYLEQLAFTTRDPAARQAHNDARGDFERLSRLHLESQHLHEICQMYKDHATQSPQPGVPAAEPPAHNMLTAAPQHHVAVASQNHVDQVQIPAAGSVSEPASKVQPRQVSPPSTKATLQEHVDSTGGSTAEGAKPTSKTKSQKANQPSSNEASGSAATKRPSSPISKTPAKKAKIPEEAVERPSTLKPLAPPAVSAAGRETVFYDHEGNELKDEKGYHINSYGTRAYFLPQKRTKSLRDPKKQQLRKDYD